MTATAVMRLVELGALDLRAPIQRYLPEFRVLDDETSRQVSLWHCLTHSPGWEGQHHDRRPRCRGAGALRLDDHADAAATGAGRQRLELQQRRLRADRPRHRGGDRQVDSRRPRRARLRAARTVAHGHAPHRRDDLALHARPPRSRRRGRSGSAVSDHVEHDRRRRPDLDCRSHALRALPPRRWPDGRRHAAPLTRSGLA